MKLVRQEGNNIARIKVTNTVKIEPGAETIVSGYVDGNFCHSDGLVEPYKLINRRGLLMAKSLTSPTNKNVAISVINLSAQNVKLKKHTAIASLNQIDSVIDINSKNTDNAQSATAEEVPKHLEHNTAQSVTGEEVPKHLEHHTAQNATAGEVPKHLESLYTDAAQDLNPTQCNKVAHFLSEFSDIFTDETGKIGQTDVVEHIVDVGDSKPIKLPPRRTPIAQKEIVDTELRKMLDQNIIEPSSSPWSSPIVLVTKSDYISYYIPSNYIRFCADFRRVNAVTKKDAYPLPRIS